MRRFILGVAIASLVLPAVFSSSMEASAQSQVPAAPGDRVTAEQAVGEKGQNVTVEGIASITDAAGMEQPGLFVRVSSHDGPNAAFAGYVTRGNLERFPDIRELDGKVIAMTGVVEATNTIPIIRLTSPDQIRIVSR